MNHIEIYTDGACKGNPGLGGWGAVLLSGGSERELFGGEVQTTNNRMELRAAIAAFQALTRPCVVEVHTDSEYLRRGITEWLATWQRNGWRNSKKEPVLNRDLWESLLETSRQHSISWKWVRGHDGHAENERCDFLAREALSQLRQQGIAD